MILRLFAVLCFLIVVIQWLWTLRIYRRISFRLLAVMSGYAMRTNRRVLYVAGWVGLIAGVGLRSDWITGMALVGLTGAILPPAVLFLGVSRPEAALLVEEIDSAISPLRLVHLLDRFSAHVSFGLAVGNTDNRPVGELSWRQLVVDLMEIAPVIAIDVRWMTEAVAFEANVAAERFPAKTVFVRADEACDAFVEEVRRRLGRGPATTSFEDEDDAYLEMLRRAGTSPLALKYEAIDRRNRSEMGTFGGREYCDRHFRIRIPATWAATQPLPQFMATGGRLAIAHSSGQASLNVSAGPLPERAFGDRAVRRAELERILRSYDDVTIDETPVDGEANAVRGEWREEHGAVSGLLSVVHDDTEYVVQWKASKTYAGSANGIVGSFCFVRDSES